MRLVNRVNGLVRNRRMAVMVLSVVLLVALAALWRTDMGTKNVSMTIDSRNNC